MRPARPGERDPADRVGPDFAGVRGDLIAVGGIGGGEGENRLLFRADLVDRGADLGERDLPAAEEMIEIEHARGDAPVVRRRFERADRPEERRVGKECVRTFRYGRSPYDEKKKVRVSEQEKEE